ncbi:MAG: iron-sulfur cluster assembly accessory protein [Alphaproteobacteria bacterium]
MPAPFSITPQALERVQVLLAQRGRPSAGIRVGTKTKGCSGLSYTLEYADEANPYDESVTIDGVTVFIDSKALLYLLGTEMDFVQNELESGFEFRNPNEKGKCGCGKSFNV